MVRVEIVERAGTGLDGTPRPTEDRVAALPNAVVLLDGATALRPQRVTVTDYVDALLAALADGLLRQPSHDLARILARSITTVVSELRVAPGASPSSTVAMLRWCKSTVDALVLGDSPVVAFGPSGPCLVADDRLERLRVAGRLGSAVAADALRNTDRGFWVAEADPGAADRARRRSWPREQVRAALAASDGASAVVDRYGLLSWQQVLALCETDGADAVLAVVRNAERHDADRARWPRAKVHDDQALAVVRF